MIEGEEEVQNSEMMTGDDGGHKGRGKEEVGKGKKTYEKHPITSRSGGGEGA